jgi:hypothetical protein
MVCQESLIVAEHDGSATGCGIEQAIWRLASARE